MANGFNFRLERLLQLKAKEMDQLKEELKKKREEIRGVESKIADLSGEIEGLYEEEIRIITSDGTNPIRREDIVRYREVLKRRRGELERLLDELRRQEDEILARLKTVMKDKKVMENLKSRMYEEYMKEWNRREIRILDDMALQRFIRGGGGVRETRR